MQLIINNSKARTYIVFLFLLVFTFIIILPLSPLYSPIPGRDSGMFLYGGWRILSGDSIYIDVWDHKPPIIFYLNALGLAVINKSTWGIWIIEFIFLLSSIVICYDFLRKNFGTIPSLFGSFIFLFSYNLVIQGGNLTTEYALPMQFILFYITLFIDMDRKNLWQFIVIGIVISAAFFTKQNTIGIGIAITIFVILNRLFRRNVQRLLFELFWLSFSFLVTSLLILMPIIFQKGLMEFWHASFVYNFHYSTSGITEKIKSVFEGFTLLNNSGLTPVAIIGIWIGMGLVILKKWPNPRNQNILTISLISLPLDLFLTSMSGRNHPHYYLTLLPTFVFFGSLTCWVFVNYLLKNDMPKLAILGIFGIILFSFLAPQLPNYYGNLKTLRIELEDPVSVYVRQYSEPTENVLLWGADAKVNFLSRRKAPSRFIYQYPLYQEGFTSESLILGFLDDIIKNQPVLIIDTHNEITPFMRFPISTKSIHEKTKIILLHYKVTENINSVTVYKLQR